MATFSDAEIHRGGARYGPLSYQHSHVSVTSSSDSVQIDFEIASKGGGFTRIVVVLGKKDFPKILEMMTNVDRPSAVRAIMNESQAPNFPPTEYLNQKNWSDPAIEALEREGISGCFNQG